MNKPEVIRVFNIKIHPLRRSEFVDIIETMLSESHYVIVQHGINAASIIELNKKKELAEVYNSAELINIDGFSMVLALRFLGYKIPERVACPDLANDVLHLAYKNHLSVFLFGTTEENVLLAVKNLKVQLPGLYIAGYRNGFYTREEEPAIVNDISSLKPDILLLGMPSPQKELFVQKYKASLEVKYTLGVGGLFDILAGKIKRAPLWMRNIGLEWTYRLIQEPHRLWRRYLIGNVKFIILVLREKLNRSKK
jgi:N-acetylglucosaminyldiphosphoundecaprenol N-acetyl-beta-D-mannosaminyltransferase